MELNAHLSEIRKEKERNAESWNIMYVMHKLILVLLLLPSLSRVLLSLQLGAVGGANSSQLCVSLRGRKDRSVTLAKINLAAVSLALITMRRLRLESKPRVCARPGGVVVLRDAGSRRASATYEISCPFG